MCGCNATTFFFFKEAFFVHHTQALRGGSYGCVTFEQGKNKNKEDILVLLEKVGWFEELRPFCLALQNLVCDAETCSWRATKRRVTKRCIEAWFSKFSPREPLLAVSEYRFQEEIDSGRDLETSRSTGFSWVRAGGLSKSYRTAALEDWSCVTLWIRRPLSESLLPCLNSSVMMLRVDVETL